MRINTSELQTLTLIVARGRFRDRIFARRDLMPLVEAVLKILELWQDEDDEESASVAKKSKGLANIDWAISNLRDKGFTHLDRDQWRVT